MKPVVSVQPVIEGQTHTYPAIIARKEADVLGIFSDFCCISASARTQKLPGLPVKGRPLEILTR